ncbi:MAG: zinc transporter ZupT [Nitrospiraceae bacterium]
MGTLLWLGFIAGVVPVFLGLGVAVWLGRILPRTWESAFVGVAVGVLLYLFFDLMHESVEFSSARDPLSWLVLLGGLGVSLVGMVALETGTVFGGHATPRTLSLPYMIAIGMGLHNLGEGLAIGASYATGDASLSLLLVLGFALHNGTEGFGIVAASGKNSVTLTEIVWLGLIAGAPTCLGALLSGQGLSSYWTILFYTFAAGSLLYVALSLTAMSYTVTRRLQMSAGVFGGIALMYITAMLLELLGGVKS